jgi:hypothetical protein
MLQRLDVKLVLAAISGVLVGTSLFDMPRPDVELFFGLPRFLYDYVLAGALFAIPILWPYLRRNNHFLLRGLALVFASELSFWCAISVYDDSRSAQPTVVVPVESIGPVLSVRHRLRSSEMGFVQLVKTLRVTGVVSAVVGGWAFGLLADVGSRAFVASYLALHYLCCSSLRYPTSRSTGACVTR